jgi:DNA-binding FadR family transcriptional regulator
VDSIPRSEWNVLKQQLECTMQALSAVQPETGGAAFERRRQAALRNLAGAVEAYLAALEREIGDEHIIYVLGPELAKRLSS